MTPEQFIQTREAKMARAMGATIQQLRQKYAAGAIIAALGGETALRAAEVAEAQVKGADGRKGGAHD